MIKRDLAALIAFLDEHQNRPHELGREANDCVGFALGAAEAQTGERIAADLHWSTKREMLALLRRLGGIEAAFDAHFERIEPAQAMRGDLAGVPDADLGIHPMVVEGVTLVCPGERGNSRAPRSVMICAWSAVQLKRPLAGAGDE